MYLSVILPLALPQKLTYALPPSMEGGVGVGSRVVVPLGSSRFYTAIVESLSPTLPQDFEGKLKEVTEVIDTAPVILAEGLRFWNWMAHYYMCTPGEVMKAALPSGLKLESETLVTRNPDFAPDDSVRITPRQQAILDALPAAKGTSIAALEKQLHSRGMIAPIRRLIEMGTVSIHETMSRGFKPRTETHLRLSQNLMNETALNAFFETLKRAPAQEQLLTHYLDLADAAAALTLGSQTLLKEVSKRQLLADFPNADSALSSLLRKGALEAYPYEIERLKRFGTSQIMQPAPLSAEQQRAKEQIQTAFSKKDVCLLHGVTSSGKTEVYIHLIHEALQAGKQVLYLVPEIALTTQLTSRLSRVFGERMGVYHSKFPDNERVELWRRQLSDKPFGLMLGVRSSLFLPFRNLGLVIVDEEHETSYKQQDPAPRYNARDAAIVLASMCGAKTLLGTATPSLETYHNATTGKYALVEMFHRFGDVQLPQVVVDDVKELQRKRLMPTPFSPRLIEAVRKVIQEGGQAILFQNRRGYSPTLECRTCGWVPRCSKCDVSLTYHQRMGKLVCHYCGTIYDIPPRCPACGDTRLRDIGYGTEKIESAAQCVFPDAKIARMDLDTTRSRTSHEKIISDFEAGRTNLLIGTQMVTKGLDFNRVKVVGILNADQLLNAPDFRAYERAFSMMTQVAGRAGRRGERGLVVLQTKQPELGVVSQIVNGNYAAFYQEQMEERQEFRFPPITRLINIYFKNRTDQICEQAAQRFAALIRPHFGADILGPDRPSVSRIKNLYIRKLTLKVALDLPAPGVRRTLQAASDLTLAVSGMNGTAIHFDVDPL